MSEQSAGDSGVRDDSSPASASADADSNASPDPDPDQSQNSNSPANSDGPQSTNDSRPVVYDLAPDCTVNDAEVGAYYHGEVNGVVEYGIFVDISDDISGLVHESNLSVSYDVGTACS